ncbi:MAG: SusC/RagA family TonB-linked outer membrane protein, partial [Muribaculaceae bacterium]|nr:SusC/RagA family TonB-linked outer membrane protein [Muribaculaceae bacterium]
MSRILTSLLLAVIGLTAFGRDYNLTGVVTSQEDGEPLIGATVRVKGDAARATVTDIDGNYNISVDKGDVLVFSYVGYTTIDRKVTGGAALNVEMSTDNVTFDDLVVIGYGSVKKSDLTGAVSSIDSDKLTKTPAASLSNALQGQVAGVSVNSLTGRPGAGAEVRIRGVGSINGASPIYVVDGVIADDIDFLSPNDIEHIEVLKDASATAIYGARGANGVIIVTTRSGSFNRPTSITLNAYFGLQQRWKKLDVMNAKEFADAYVAINGNASAKKIYAEQGFNQWLSLYEGVRNSDYYPVVYDPEKNPDGFDYSAVDTDWQDEVFRTGKIQNYHLAIDGGGDKFTYAMSGSWFQQDGIIIGSNYSRFTGRLNTTFKAFPWLKIGENISFTASVAKNAYESGDNSESAGASILSAAFAMAPWDPTHYP